MCSTGTKQTRAVAAALLLGCSVGAGTAQGTPCDDWLTFRGSQRMTGAVPCSLPMSFALAWTFRTEGPVKSSAVIYSGRVFVGSNDGRVHAIDQRTGVKLWEFKTDGTVEAPPCVVGDCVYAGSTDQRLYCLDAKTGTARWNHKTDGKIMGGANWLGEDPKSRKIVVGSYDNRLYCLDAATGNVAWSYTAGNYINGAPAVTGSQVVFAGCDGKVRSLEATTGKPIVTVDVGSYVAGTVAVDKELAYVGHYGNEVACVNLASNRVEWTYRDQNFPFFSSPAVGETRVVIGCRDKRVHCLDRETGERVWTFPTRGNVDSSPVISGDRVVCGSSDGFLYVLDLKTGRELWSYEIGAPITASPAVANGMIIVGAEDGTVYAFGKKQN